MKKREKSVLWAWAFSYIVILLIPTISSLINYKVNIDNINQGILDTFELVLENIDENIEYFMTAEKELYAFTCNREKLDYLNNYTTPDISFYRTTAEMYNEFFSYVKSKSHVINGTLFLRNIDYLISDQRAKSMDDYYTTLKYSEKNVMNHDEWECMIKEEYNNVFFVGPQIHYTEEKALIFANTIRGKKYDNVTVFVSIPLSEIAELTRTMKNDNYLILSVSDSHTVAFCEGRVVEIPAEILENNYENKWVQIEGTLNENSDISSRLFVSKKHLRDELAYTKSIFFMNLALTMAFGITGIIYLIKKNYYPLQTLLKSVTDNQTKGNEFSVIAQAYKKVENEKQSYRELLDKQKVVLRSSWLLSLMKGRSSSAYLKEQKISLVSEIKGNIAIVGFMIPMNQKRGVELDELLFLGVDRLFKELIKKYNFYCIEDGRFLYYLLDLKETAEEEWLTYAVEKIELLYSRMEDNMSGSLNCVISGVENKLDNIHALYRKLADTFEFQDAVGGVGVITTMELEGNERTEKIQENIRVGLVSALHSEDLEKALNIVDDYFSSNKHLSFYSFKMYAYDLFNNIIAVFQEYDNRPDRGVKILKYVELFIQARDTDTLKGVFIDTLEYVSGRISNQIHKSSGVITEQIKTYIHEHYAEGGINISSIADSLQRTPKNISKIFKDETGEGILDYINRYRIMQAMELMKEKRYTWEELARQVGYWEGRDFRRIFTKVMGMSPSEYFK